MDNVVELHNVKSNELLIKYNTAKKATQTPNKKGANLSSSVVFVENKINL
mgnify:CR=1 FL=1